MNAARLIADFNTARQAMLAMFRVVAAAEPRFAEQEIEATTAAMHQIAALERMSDAR